MFLEFAAVCELNQRSPQLHQDQNCRSSKSGKNIKINAFRSFLFYHFFFLIPLIVFLFNMLAGVFGCGVFVSRAVEICAPRAATCSAKNVNDLLILAFTCGCIICRFARAREFMTRAYLQLGMLYSHVRFFSYNNIPDICFRTGCISTFLNLIRQPPSRLHFWCAYFFSVEKNWLSVFFCNFFELS